MLTELTLLDQLDGPANDFGRRFWSMVFSAAPELEAKIGQAQPLAQITYSDRYLVAPIVVRLLYEILRHLSSFPNLVDDDTQVLVQTTFPRAGKHNLQTIEHNWRHESEPRLVLARLLESCGGRIEVRRASKDEIPHFRELSLCWRDGLRWRLRPDHGFGFWKPCERSLFRFDLPVDEQAEELRSTELSLVARDDKHPTILYLSSLEKSEES